MKHWKRILVLFLFAFMTLFPTNIKAQERFNIDNYDITVIVNEDGSLNIHEKLDLDFSSSAHGFYRNIPIRYEMDWGEEYGKKTYYFPISNINVRHDPYEVESNTDGVRIKIGDPDEYVIGNKSYDLSYTIQQRDLMIDQDYFYLNLISGFDCRIENVRFTIEFPKSFDMSLLQFYGGTIDFKVNGNTVTGKNTQPLYNDENVTAYLPLGDHYFNFAPIQDYTMLFAGITVGLLLLSLLLYLKFGRVQKPVITIEFNAPKGLNSAGVGYVIDGIVNSEDILSMIIDFANRGYLSIHDHEDPDKIELVKLKDIDKNAPAYEINFMRALFKKKENITLLELKENNFGTDIATAKEQIYGFFNVKKNKVFSTGSSATQIFMTILSGLPVAFFIFASIYQEVGMVEIALLPAIFAWPLISASMILWVFLSYRKHVYSKTKLNLFLIGTGFVNAVLLWIAMIFMNQPIQMILSILSTILFIYMIYTSRRRSEIGNQWLGQILGLKEFILAAEKDRLEMLVKDNPTYFYSILPYAYVLGISDVWCEKFESINIDSPDWYVSTNLSTFTTMYWLNQFNRTMYSMSSLPAAVPAPSSGSGGFSGGGGGFSGGGFGGGGGGSW